MNDERSDASEPMWELEDFLGDEAAELEEETMGNGRNSSENQTNPGESGAVYDLEHSLEEGGDGSAPESERSSGHSDWFSYASTVLTILILVIVSVSVYIAVPFGLTAGDGGSSRSVTALSEQEVQSWIEHSKKLASVFSRNEVSILSSSVLGYSSEMSKRPALSNLVKSTLNDIDYSEYRRMTRDIGNSLKLPDNGTGTDETEMTSQSVVHQNKQVVDEYRGDIHEVLERLREGKRRTTENTEPGSSPVESSDSSGGGLEVK